MNIFGLTIGAVAFVAVSAVSAVAVTNGDFETGDLTGWTVTPTANGFTEVQDVVPFDTTGGGASNAARFNVGQVSFQSGVPAGITLSQTFNVLTAGLSSFAADIATMTPSGQENVSGGIFELILNGVVLDTVDFGTIGLGSTERGSLSAVANVIAGLNTLAIRISRPFETTLGVTPTQYVDNVTAKLPDTMAPIPVPASLPLLVGALGAVAMVRRRKKAA